MTHDDARRDQPAQPTQPDLPHLRALPDLPDLPEDDHGPQRMTVRSAADALALVPVVMGFHPEDSLVLVTFGGEGFHARVDLPVEEAERREVVTLLVDALRANPCQVAMLVMYSEDEQVCAALAAELVPALVDGLDVAVADVVRADGERWWSVEPGGEHGPGTAYDISSHPFTADSVLRGRVVRASRSQLAERLVVQDPEVVEAVAEAAAGWARAAAPGIGPQRREQAHWLRRTVERWRCAGGPGEPAEVGRVLVLVADAGLRDVVWGALERRDAGVDLEVWLEVVRRSPREWAASPLAVVGLQAWLHGDGALAWTAVESSLELDPENSLAHLVAEALERAVPPSTWRPWAVEELLAVHG